MRFAEAEHASGAFDNLGRHRPNLGDSSTGARRARGPAAAVDSAGRVSFRLYYRIDTAPRELVCAVRMPPPSLHSNCELHEAPRAALVVVSVDAAAPKRATGERCDRHVAKEKADPRWCPQGVPRDRSMPWSSSAARTRCRCRSATWRSRSSRRCGSRPGRGGARQAPTHNNITSCSW